MRLAALLALALAGCTWVERDPGPARDQPPPIDPVPRFGVTAVHPDRVDLARSGASWYLNWTADPTPGVELEFVPMVCAYVGAGPVSQDELDALGRKASGYPDRTLFLVGNEVGHPPQGDLRTPAQYARDFAACREALLSRNPTFRFSTGPMILAEPALYAGAGGSLHYLRQLLEVWESDHGAPIPADFIAATAHLLPDDDADVGVFAAQVGRFRRFLYENGLADRPVIVTEYGAALGDADDATRLQFLLDATRFLATARDEEVGHPQDDYRLVQRFAWFNADPIGTLEKLRLMGTAGFAVNISRSALFARNGQLSELGVAYARIAAASRE